MEQTERKSEAIVSDMERKIRQGYYLKGQRLPSQQDLRLAYHAGDGTIRQVIAQLTARGYIATHPRMLPVVIYEGELYGDGGQRPDLKEADEIVRTLLALMPPLVVHCLARFRPQDWDSLAQQAAMLEKHIEKGVPCGPLLHACWTAIFARGGNERITALLENINYLRPVGVLSTQANRCEARCLIALAATQSSGGEEAAVVVSGWLGGRSGVASLEEMPSIGRTALILKMFDHMTRYEYVLRHLILKIGLGDYQKGDFLPSYKAIEQAYQVSSITVSRVFKELKRLGAVRMDPGRGMRLQCSMENLRLPYMESEAKQTQKARVYMQTLQLVALTCGEAARLAAPLIPVQQARTLEMRIAHPQSHPLYTITYAIGLLELLAKYIPNLLLREIYRNLYETCLPGPSALIFCVHPDPIQRQALNESAWQTVHALTLGDGQQFAQLAKDFYSDIYAWLSKAFMDAGLHQVVSP